MTEAQIVKQYRDAATEELLKRIRDKPDMAMQAIKDNLHKRDSCFYEAWILYQMEQPNEEK